MKDWVVELLKCQGEMVVVVMILMSEFVESCKIDIDKKVKEK